jgi:hypothetical protein
VTPRGDDTGGRAAAGTAGHCREPSFDDGKSLGLFAIDRDGPRRHEPIGATFFLLGGSTPRAAVAA